jgi:hypothetical protein
MQAIHVISLLRAREVRVGFKLRYTIYAQVGIVHPYLFLSSFFPSPSPFTFTLSFSFLSPGMTPPLLQAHYEPMPLITGRKVTVSLP